MRRKPFPLASLLCTALLLSAAEAGAQSLVAAKVLSVDGPVEIKRVPQGELKLKKISFAAGHELRAGDRIKTGWGGRLILGVPDGSMAVIGERTTVDITQPGGSPRTLFNVIRGNTRIHIEKLGGRPNPYRVNTPTAVIAVRGTLFDVLANENETRVFVLDGQVAVSSIFAPQPEVLLSAGQATRVRRDATPQTPEVFKPGRNDNLFRRREIRRLDDAALATDAAAGITDAAVSTGRVPATRQTPVAVSPAASGSTNTTTKTRATDAQRRPR